MHDLVCPARTFQGGVKGGGGSGEGQDSANGGRVPRTRLTRSRQIISPRPHVDHPDRDNNEAAELVGDMAALGHPDPTSLVSSRPEGSSGFRSSRSLLSRHGSDSRSPLPTCFSSSGSSSGYILSSLERDRGPNISRYTRWMYHYSLTALGDVESPAIGPSLIFGANVEFAWRK